MRAYNRRLNVLALLLLLAGGLFVAYLTVMLFVSRRQGTRDRAAKAVLAGFDPSSVRRRLWAALEPFVIDVDDFYVGRFDCPKCGEPLMPLTGRAGTTWGCTSYPSCTYTRVS